MAIPFNMKYGRSRLLILIPVFLFFWPIVSSAQMNSANVQLANLRSDVDRLDQVVRSLRLEVEALRRENREMQDGVKKSLEGNSDGVSSVELNAILKDFERKIQSVNQASRQSLINEVSKEIETLTAQTQKAINAVAKAVEGQPALPKVVVFSENYPQTGTSYTVKSGDSLAQIARVLGSTVDWIRNANRLSSDVIHPGQELFIPLKN